MTTSIEWATHTWNPVVGCQTVSPGCDHCYAATVASRQMQPAHEGLTIGRKWSGVVRTIPERVLEPLAWSPRRPRRVFVGSMTDLFHPDVPRRFLEQLWAVMALAPEHTFMVLTKRPARMARLLTDPEFAANVDGDAFEIDRERSRAVGWLDSTVTIGGNTTRCLPNVWLGTSIESQRYAWRADDLRDTPAAIRFLSLEPLIAPVDPSVVDGIDWAIVGGESGPGARPMHPDWVRVIRDRCLCHCGNVIACECDPAPTGTAFFFKQWGEHITTPVFDAPSFAGGRAFRDPRGGTNAATVRERSPQRSWRLMEPGDVNGHGTMLDHNTIAVRVGKKAAGRMLDGQTWDALPTSRSTL